jgi:hypothetical protein
MVGAGRAWITAPRAAGLELPGLLEAAEEVTVLLGRDS